MTSEPCIRMAQLLRRGDAAELPYACLDELLTWVSGGRHPGSQPLTDILGQPSDDIGLLKRVYALLDKALFVQGRFFTPIIELNTSPSAEVVRQRYRTLVVAFHPDRCPALSDWLTPRSQEINAAYAVWKEARGERREARGERREARGERREERGKR